MPEAYPSKVTVARKPLRLNRQKALISRGVWQQVLGGDLNSANPSRQVWTFGRTQLKLDACGCPEHIKIGQGNRRFLESSGFRKELRPDQSVTRDRSRARYAGKPYTGPSLWSRSPDPRPNTTSSPRHL